MLQMPGAGKGGLHVGGPVLSGHLGEQRKAKTNNAA